MKLYLLLIVLTALIVTGAVRLSNLDLTRIETDPAAAFILAPTLPVRASNDPVTVKMSVAPCGNQPRDDNQSVERRT
ncbi:MAG: hypothetical protein HS126_04390 [Anaerolineales bacterium]|nr:hypothetical protein [Anaerolineales bacterium]